MREDRLIKWFSKDEYERLGEEDRTNLIGYRRLYNRCVKREKKIERLLTLIKKDKEELRGWYENLTYMNGNIDHLRSNFVFSLSVNSYTKKDIKYYNISLKRRGRDPKSIYLGREEVIREHMSKYFGDKKYLNPRSNWEGDLTLSGIKGKLKDNITGLILDDPHGFNQRKITLKEILPLDDED